MRLAAEWMVVPRSTVRAAHLALFGGISYLGVAYLHFWSRPLASSPWPSLVLAALAVGSLVSGASLLRVSPNSWSLSHTYFVLLGLGNLALVPLMFDLPVILVPLGGGVCVLTLVRLQTEDAFAIAEPEAQNQKPKPVLFKLKRPGRF